MRESSIEAKLKAICALHGTLCHKLHRSRNGEADRIICPRGAQAFYVEVKQPGEALKEAQLIRLVEARKAGFETLVFDGSEQATLSLLRYFNGSK